MVFEKRFFDYGHFWSWIELKLRYSYHQKDPWDVQNALESTSNQLKLSLYRKYVLYVSKMILVTKITHFQLKLWPKTTFLVILGLLLHQIRIKSLIQGCMHNYAEGTRTFVLYLQTIKNHTDWLVDRSGSFWWKKAKNLLKIDKMSHTGAPKISHFSRQNDAGTVLNVPESTQNHPKSLSLS